MYVRDGNGYIKIIRTRKKVQVICFSGHRHIFGDNWNTSSNKKLMTKMKYHILQIMKESGATDFLFIVGGSIGIDQMACKIVLDLRELLKAKYSIKVCIAIPYEEHPVLWNKVQQKRYLDQMEEADELVFVDELPEYAQAAYMPVGKYHRDKNFARNRYMVDRSHWLIAVHDGRKAGGTTHCINYARKRDINILTIIP